MKRSQLLVGLIAPLVAYSGILTAIYVNRSWWKLTDNAISDLGKIGLPPHNWLLNVPLVITAVLAIYYALGLLDMAGNSIEKAGIWVLIAGFVFLALIGLFPEGTLPPHYYVSWGLFPDGRLWASDSWHRHGAFGEQKNAVFHGGSVRSSMGSCYLGHENFQGRCDTRVHRSAGGYGLALRSPFKDLGQNPVSSLFFVLVQGNSRREIKEEKVL